MAQPNLSVLGEFANQLTRTELLKSWAAHDIGGVFVWIDNHLKLGFVCDNIHALMDMGVYEQALLWAYQGHNHNFKAWSLSLIKHLFTLADPDKLRAAGDPIPERESYTLYRGVAGVGRARCVNGISWTSSFKMALWFANRYQLVKPAVFTITVSRNHILAYLSERNESEYLLRLPLPKKPKRIEVQQWQK